MKERLPVIQEGGDVALLQQKTNDGLVALRGGEVERRPSVIVGESHIHTQHRVPTDSGCQGDYSCLSQCMFSCESKQPQ